MVVAWGNVDLFMIQRGELWCGEGYPGELNYLGTARISGIIGCGLQVEKDEVVGWGSGELWGKGRRHVGGGGEGGTESVVGGLFLEYVLYCILFN